MKINYIECAESTEYNACSYTVNGQKIIERTAKITPKKIGQFVTCWKRNIDGITEAMRYMEVITVIASK